MTSDFSRIVIRKFIGIFFFLSLKSTNFSNSLNKIAKFSILQNQARFFIFKNKKTKVVSSFSATESSDQ
jgi:hypothetical protein